MSFVGPQVFSFYAWNYLVFAVPNVLLTCAILFALAAKVFTSDNVSIDWSTFKIEASAKERAMLESERQDLLRDRDTLIVDAVHEHGYGRVAAQRAPQQRGVGPRPVQERQPAGEIRHRAEYAHVSQ